MHTTSPSPVILAPKRRPPLLYIANSKAETIEKYLAQHIKNHETDCWEWTGLTTESRASENRYGIIFVRLEGRRYKLRAHRVAWALSNQKDPGDLLICHECDNTLCINPSHLFLGTPSQNMQDMHDKGRHPLSPNYTP